MAYRAVLFDFFGTLTMAVTGPSATLPIARALGCDAAALATLLVHTYLPRARGEFGDSRSQLLRLARMLGRTPAPNRLATAARLREEAIAATARLRADAVATLEQLRAIGLRIGLVSDCTEEVPRIIARLPIAGLLDTTVYSCEVGACKPDERLFRLAARQLDVQPADCVYVGDGGARELWGADAVGMTAVRLAAADLREHVAHEPAPYWPGLAVPRLADVPALVVRGSLRAAGYDDRPEASDGQ